MARSLQVCCLLLSGEDRHGVRPYRMLPPSSHVVVRSRSSHVWLAASASSPRFEAEVPLLRCTVELELLISPCGPLDHPDRPYDFDHTPNPR